MLLLGSTTPALPSTSCFWKSGALMNLTKSRAASLFLPNLLTPNPSETITLPWVPGSIPGMTVTPTSSLAILTLYCGSLLSACDQKPTVLISEAARPWLKISWVSASPTAFAAAMSKNLVWKPFSMDCHTFNALSLSNSSWLLSSLNICPPE